MRSGGRDTKRSSEIDAMSEPEVTQENGDTDYLFDNDLRLDVDHDADVET